MSFLAFLAVPFLLNQASKPTLPAQPATVGPRLEQALGRLSHGHLAMAQSSVGTSLNLQAFKDYDIAAWLDPTNADAAWRAFTQEKTRS
jgi:hypothetical protein